jgi:spermidine/putrescine-binding protein
MRYLFFMSIATLFAIGCTKQPPTLNLLVWEGYADPSFVKEFETQNKCRVTASYMGSSDELMAKLRGGSSVNYDLISPSSDVAGAIVKAGLAAPLDLNLLPSYLQLAQKLRDLAMVKQEAVVFGVPFTWGPDPLLYDKTAFPSPPQSWADLWHEKYKGKISVWDDLSTIYMTAQVLGFDKGNPAALYNLTDEQLELVKKKLIALKPNIRKFWTSGGELTNLFQNKEIVAAMGWPLMTNQLKKAQFPVGEIIPKENTTGWIDHLMITSTSEQKALAHKFIEYMINAKTQKAVADVTGYVPANPKSGELMSEEQRQSLHLHEADAYMAKLNFWQNVDRRAKYNEIWNEIKAAQ